MSIIRLGARLAVLTLISLVAGVSGARAQLLDPAFNPGANQWVERLALQADAKILVVGGFSMLGGGGTGTTARRGLARLNPDGSLDASFINLYSSPGRPMRVVPLTDGRILIAGDFLNLNDGSGATEHYSIARLNTDGSIDQGFNPGVGIGDGGIAAVLAIVPQADGKIVIGGGFTRLGGGGWAETGLTRQRIGRLNADGSVDETFDPGADGTVFAIATQPDGKMIVAGSFTGLGGGTGTTPRNRIGRLNADGSVDESFDPGADGAIWTCVLQPDGKVLLGGDFTMLGGGGTGTATRNRIARLNADGSLDTSFNPGASGAVRALAVQPDGQILVGGYFTTLGGGGTGTVARNRIARLNPDGSLDMTWNPGANDWVETLLAQPDGKTLVGGWFTKLGGGTGTTTRSRIGRFLADPPDPPSVTMHPANQTVRAGQLAQFTAAADGTPAPTIQYQASADGGDTWTNPPGATSTTYTVTATAAKNGWRFRALFTNAQGTATTTAATLTVRSVSGSDFDGDATTDIAVYRRTTGFWYVGNDQWVHYGGPGYVPVAGDYNGDGTTDIAVYEPSSGAWYVRGQFWTQFGDPGDIPVPGDYDGDGTTDLAVYRPSTGGWFVRNQLVVTGFGGSGYVPVVADYDGNGSTDIAVYQPSTGLWYVRGNWGLFGVQFGGPGDVPVPGNYLFEGGPRGADLAVYQPSTGIWRVRLVGRGILTVEYGRAGDLPVPRDYDGNGTADIAVYRPSTGEWFVRNEFTPQFTLQFGDAMDVPVPSGPVMLLPVDGDYDGDRVANLAAYTTATGRWRVQNGADVVYGEPTDKPVPADYDGSGSMDIAVYRPSTGVWYVRDQFTVQFGDAEDIPVPGDYNGDRLADVAVYRPSTGYWYIRNQLAVHFGDPGDIPVPGDYNGDGLTEIAVYRPSTGYWYVRNQMAVQCGPPGAVPVPGDYNGDGITDLAVFDTSTGTWHVRGYAPIVFGAGTDTPVPGDYDGDGTTDIAVYTPATATWDVRNQFTIVFGDPGDVPVVRAGGSQ